MIGLFQEEVREEIERHPIGFWTEREARPRRVMEVKTSSRKFPRIIQRNH
jgi:hypothetical protein